MQCCELDCCACQVDSMQAELLESRQGLEAASSEVECLREMVTGWEEAFAKAQQELDALKVCCAIVLP